MVYLRILSLRFKHALSSLLIYRATSLIAFSYISLGAVSGFLSVKVYFSGIEKLEGWTEFELLVLVGSFQLMLLMYEIFCLWAQDYFAYDIVEGNLNIHLLRPVSTLFLATVREPDLPSFFSLPIPLSLIYLGVSGFDVSPSLSDYFLFAAACLLGAFFIFCLTQILLNFSFWVEGDVGMWALADEIIKFGSRPKDIYSMPLQMIFATIFPVVTALNLPSEIIRNNVSLNSVALTASACLILFVLMKIQWNLGLRRYQGAGS